MVKVPYCTGVRAEHRARDELKSQGYFIIRSAGSRGLVDIVAICADHIKLIQVKVISFGEKKKFIQEQMNLGYLQCPENVFKELWVWEKHARWYVYKIKGMKEYRRKKK